LTLVSETEYYFSIRATNIVDLTSNVSTSDGILYIDPEDLTIADFTIANTEVCPETPIEFVNLSLNAISVEWTITGPQNETSTDFEPSIVLAGGDYEIELIAYGAITNDTIVKEFTIEVLDNPIADFGALETTIYLPDATAYFINNCANADTYYWDFGDGNNSTDFEPYHTYLETGEYTISLEAISSECGSDILTQTDYIIVLDPTLLDISQSESFIIYPNPVSDRLLVVLSEGNIKHLQLFDSTGKLVFEQSSGLSKVELSVSEFNSGMYILKVCTDNNTYQTKIVLEK